MKKKTQKIRRRGPNVAPVKVATNVRLSPVVLTYYRETGAGWQTRLNDDLVALVGRRTRVAADDARTRKAVR